MSNGWLPSIPSLPVELKLSAKEGNLVVFVGAGVSRLKGSPSWDAFSNKALEQLATLGIVTFGEIEQLSQLNPKTRLSIAIQVAKSSNKILDYEKLILPRKSNSSKIYEYLSSIGCVFVTTNYDRFLDAIPPKVVSAHTGDAAQSSSPAEQELICRPTQFSGNLLRKPGTVIHLHGSIDDINSMIISTTDYLRHYSDPRVVEFLQAMFDRNTVLFIGYGLDELELLEHLIRKANSQSYNQKRRFLLQGFFSHQERTFFHLENYFREAFDTYLVAFSKDKKTFDQLEEVMEKWVADLEVGNPLSADDLAFIKGVLDV